MTLEEAIKHCFDVYNRLKTQDLEDCECAEEHKQLAEWLEELKERREDSTKDYNRGYADGARDGYAFGVPKGKWILDIEGSDGLTWFRCSECNAMEKLEKNNINAKFCWNCGAKMEVNDGKF